MVLERSIKFVDLRGWFYVYRTRGSHSRIRDRDPILSVAFDVASKRIDSWRGCLLRVYFVAHSPVDLFRTTSGREETRAPRSSGRNNLPADPLASSLSVLFILSGCWESFRGTRELDLDGLVLSLVLSLY